MKAKWLTLPSVLAVVAIGGAVAIGAIASCGDDDPPQDCQIEGMCPTDGRICVKQSDHVTLCCPICPVNNVCPNDCVLDNPPV